MPWVQPVPEGFHAQTERRGHESVGAHRPDRAQGSGGAALPGRYRFVFRGAGPVPGRVGGSAQPAFQADRGHERRDVKDET
ncbi:hypothetical protein DESC_590096 [Desulfosarcina cetonica]|nr:hypothetical protein DESC_590096 [Desulfosarcina cetonica]